MKGYSMIEEYRTPEELLNFILTECGDMEYNLDFENIFYRQDNLRKNIKTPMTAQLDIKTNFNMEKVFYAINFLKEYFDVTINDMIISDSKAEIDEGYLDKTTIEYLYIVESVKLPKLPITLHTLGYTNENGDETNLLRIRVMSPQNRITIYRDKFNLEVIEDITADDFQFYFDTKEEALEKMRTYYD